MSLPKVNATERRRLQKLHRFEIAARQKGYSLIAGIDEAGRGPLAGPVVAAACIIPEGVFVVGVDDSKKLSAEKRNELFNQITSHSQIKVGIGVVSHEDIDRINIFQATIQAMLMAVEQLDVSPDFLLVDGLKLPHPTIPCEKIIDGDQKSHSIASASILAKETRDRLMVDFDKQWPQYGFAQHKGYGTANHLAALTLHGPCPIHRRSFSPIKGT